jgi:hypothetical protein
MRSGLDRSGLLTFHYGSVRGVYQYSERVESLWCGSGWDGMNIPYSLGEASWVELVRCGRERQELSFISVRK